jgi:adenylate kinase
MNFIILGPQGSGKGTQAELLSKKFKLAHVEMGGILREIAMQKTALGKKVNEIINKKKELVPDEVVRKALGHKLKSISKNKGIIFDGIPRKTTQIKLIESILKDIGRSVDKVIFVKISGKESIKRISKRFHCEKCKKSLILGKNIQSSKSKCPLCGGIVSQRTDDTVAGVRKRLAIFKKETLPVISFYRRKKILVEINGEKPIRDIFKQILKKINDQH